jgi:zinc protease
MRTISRFAAIIALVAAGACGGSSAATTETAPPANTVEPAAPETPAQPTADQVLEAYLEATGGRAAREAKQNYRATGTVSIPQMGLEGKLELLAARPANMVTRMDLGGMGMQEQGTNGELVWEKSSMTGARIVEGNEAAHLRRASAFNADLKWKELYEKVELVGEADIDGRPAWELAFHTPEGSVETTWYDKETKLPLASEATIDSQMGKIKVKSTMSDWRDVGGVKWPFVTKQDMVNMSMVLTMDELEYDVELPENAFAPPAEIEALQSK